MKITIRHSEKLDHICIRVDGFCNHFDQKEEEVDFGRLDRRYADHSDLWEVANVCQGCGEVLEDSR